MSNELELIKDINNLPMRTAMPGLSSLCEVMPEHRDMLQSIQKQLPEISRGNSFFGKHQSQYMDTMMTVSHPTPVRNLRQILAEINNTMGGMRESHYKQRKTIVECEILKRDMENEKDDLKKKLTQVDIEEKLSNIRESRLYISGAIRKIKNYMDQYQHIMDSMGIKGFNELDFEREEERYHIMTVFTQALTAARSRGGVIDEGNMIYFHQCGINGLVAQACISTYLQSELDMARTGNEPTYDMTVKFLNDMADKFKGSAQAAANFKGMGDLINEAAILHEGLKEFNGEESNEE